MGVNPAAADSPNLSATDLDLVAAYAADAVDLDDVLVVETRLAADASVTAAEHALRQAASAYAELLVDEIAPPTLLRQRTLAACMTARPGLPPTAATASVTFRVESERFLTTLGRLGPGGWSKPVDPPEFAGWTVHDLATHVTSNQSLLAQLLGSPDPDVPETDNSNDARTAIVQQRHRAMTPAETVAEYRRATHLIEQRVAGRADDDLSAELSWWGTPMRVSTVLLHRSFETWMHYDDVRRIVGLPELPAPAPSLAAMSTRASEWTPMFLAATERTVEGEVAVIDLTGPGGGRHTVALGFDPIDPRRLATADPRFTLRMSVLEYCRAIGNRVPDGGCTFEAEGDIELASALVGALPSLAAL